MRQVLKRLYHGYENKCLLRRRNHFLRRDIRGGPAGNTGRKRDVRRPHRLRPPLHHGGEDQEEGRQGQVQAHRYSIQIIPIEKKSRQKKKFSFSCGRLMTNDFWESIKFIFPSGEARETNFTADDFRMNVNRLVIWIQ